MSKNYFVILSLVYWFCLKVNENTELEYGILKAQLLFITWAKRLCCAGISCLWFLSTWLLPLSDLAGVKRLCLHRCKLFMPFPDTQVLPVHFDEFFPWLILLFRCMSVKYATRCDMSACCASFNRFQKQLIELPLSQWCGKRGVNSVPASFSLVLWRGKVIF